MQVEQKLSCYVSRTDLLAWRRSFNSIFVYCASMIPPSRLSFVGFSEYIALSRQEFRFLSTYKQAESDQ